MLHGGRRWLQWAVQRQLRERLMLHSSLTFYLLTPPFLLIHTPQLPAGGHPVCGAHLCLCQEPAHPVCHSRPRTLGWGPARVRSWASMGPGGTLLPLHCRHPVRPSCYASWHLQQRRAAARASSSFALLRSRRAARGRWRLVPLPHRPPAGRHAPATWQQRRQRRGGCIRVRVRWRGAPAGAA